MQRPEQTDDRELGLQALTGLRTVPVESPAAEPEPNADGDRTDAGGPFDSEREFRFCKAVVAEPMLPSSRYPALAGMAPKTAQPIRESLLTKGYLREHKIETGRRGRSAICLEPLPAGIAAIAQHLGSGVTEC